MSKLAEAKRCRNEAAQIKKKNNIMDLTTQASITALLDKSADIINELTNDATPTAVNLHEVQNAMFNISINCMVSNESIRQIVKEMTNAFEFLLQAVEGTMNNLKRAISKKRKKIGEMSAARAILRPSNKTCKST